MGKWFRKKQKTEETVWLCQGVRLVQDVKMGDMTPSQDVLVKGLSEALIMFGAVGGFLSCLEVNYYVFAVALAYVVAAAYFSYLFKSGKGWVRDLGYILFFGVFCLGILAFRWYINSGFYAIINMIYEEASTYFDMAAVRDFQEVIADRRLTITIAVIFIGVAGIVILNVYLSTYMSILAAVLVSIPVFTIPLFFRKEPDSFYVIMLLAGLAGVVVQKGNGHYQYNKKRSQFTIKKKQIVYTQSGRAVFQVILSMLVLSVLLISAVNVLYPKERFGYRYRNSSLKASMEDAVENVMLSGLWSLFDFYRGTGGMSGGRLGGVSSVRADYQPDLEVVFAPYSYDRIYLKGFVGEKYAGDRWTKDADGLQASAMGGMAKARMDIKNVGASDNYLYLPYYADLSEDAYTAYREEMGIAYGQQQQYSYYPDVTLPVSSGTETSTNPIFAKEEQIKDSYLAVPEENTAVISAFCDKHGIVQGDAKEQSIDKVVTVFQQEYPYTLRPGSMPRNGDFVNYFLEKNKKGYCAHFASSAVLIFRYLGIPARYVEGYVIDYTSVMDADLAEGKAYSDYYEGEAPLGETAVVTATITDADAHAWVEVYLDGRWQVVEVTPSADEEDIDDFWSVFGTMMSRGEDNPDAVEGVNIGQSFSLDRMRWLFVAILGGMLCVCVLWTGSLAVKKGRRVMRYHSRNVRENVIAYYREICECMRCIEPEFSRAGSHREQLLWIMPESQTDVRSRLAGQLEQISYSEEAQGEDVQALLTELKQIWKEEKKRFSWKARWRMFFR